MPEPLIILPPDCGVSTLDHFSSPRAERSTRP